MMKNETFLDIRWMMALNQVRLSYTIFHGKCNSALVTPTIGGYDKIHSTVILFLRNPFEALIEFEELKGIKWDTQVSHNTFTWMIRSKSWICNAQSLHLVTYETFKKDLKQGLKSILKYLNRSPEEEKLDCATKFGVSLDTNLIQRQTKLFLGVFTCIRTLTWIQSGKWLGRTKLRLLSSTIYFRVRLIFALTSTSTT